MTNKARLAAALKAIPPGTRGSIAPQSSGYGRISPVQSESYYNNPYQGSYGPFFPRDPGVFSDGAFGPMPPIQPVPVDQPPDGSNFPDPRYWQPRPGWNLPTPPGSEGLKLASFDQLKVLSERYSVARACIDLRQEEIRGLSWQIGMTKDAAKHYQGSNSLMKDFGKRAAEATKFFRQPDPGYWNFDSFLNALLEEILVYDSLCLVFRPKYGAKFGLGGRGLLGSNLDSIRLVSGPTIRPLIDMHGDTPLPPNPAYQQYLYGVPRSDYLTLMRGSDIDDYGLTGSQVGEYASDMMLYAPYWTRRESPYGFPPVERALLPIVSGLQKQEFQLDYFKEGSVPAIYISPGDPNITPTQIKELQDALNGIAGDPAYHLKVVVLPPGSKVEPQRAVDLSDGFDLLVQTQVCMAFDVQPIELGILPNIGGGSSQQSGPSGAAVRLGSMEARDIKSRKSTKPLLQFLSDIFNMVLQDICGQKDMQFQFEGLADDEDKQAITELGVEQVQNGIASIDEIRDRLDMPPWGLTETSEPVVFTAQGPIPFSMAPQLILAAQQGANGGNNSGSSKPKSNNRTQSTNSGQRSSNSGAPRTKQPAIRQGGQTKPNGSHPAPVSPHRESLTPAHSAASGAIQSSTPRTGGTTSRSSVAGSRKKAVEAEFGALKRHLRKGRLISTWEPEHIDERALSMIAEDVAKGVLIDVAVDRAAMFVSQDYVEGFVVEEPDVLGKADTQWPGWEHDLGLVGAYKHEIGEAFKTADVKAGDIRKDAAMGRMFVDNSTLRSLIAEEVHGTFLNVLEPLWTEAWDLGYEAAKSLATGGDPDFTVKYEGEALDNFVDTEGQHWLDQIARTGLKNATSRAEVIARTEVARAMNAAAIQAYRDFGVTHKHLLIAPDDMCDICKAAEDEGVIPLDAIFPSGGLGGPFHPNCVIGSTLVSAKSRIRGASVRDYVGEFIIIKTAAGDELTVTPNHPVATRTGWVAAAELQVGDDVLRSEHAQREVDSVNPDVDDIPSRIEKIAEALPVAFTGVPVSPEDFHGDGSGSEICVVRTNGFLVNDWDVQVTKERGENLFGSGHVASIAASLFDTTGDSLTVRDFLNFTAYSIMSGAGKSSTFSGISISHASIHGFATSARNDSGFYQAASDHSPVDSEGFCESLLADSAEITLDKIVDVKRDVLATQVYNLETDDGWYIANNIVTHNCRCVPAPDGVDVEPPQAHIGKAEEDSSEDPSMVAFILYRSFSGDKEVFFLQKRGEDMNNPGTWGMPGGTSHSGEDPFETAWRESREEMGELPAGMVNGHFHERKNDRDIHIFLIDVPAPFTPLMNGSTPNETSGYGWFTRKEIKHLKLQPNFEEQWKNINWDAVGKHVSVTENGEMLTTKPQDDELYPAGARWPYPHRSDGAENPHYGTAETPEPPSRNPSQNTPAPSQPKDNMWDGPSSQVYEDDETDEFPKRRTRNQGPKKNPSQEPGMPQNTDGGTNGGGGSVGASTGVPPSGKAAPVPAVGSVPARAPKPMSPRSTPPEVFDPAENIATEDENGNIAYYPQKKVKGTGGPSDYSDANPVDPEHVLNLMRANFPEEALRWVRRARWVGPVNIPWERIDTDDIEGWAASHQLSAVHRFAKDIEAGRGHTNPSIAIQDNDSPKAILIDGHHRALARRKLGKPVLAYLGMIDPKDRLAAEETHSLQVNQGSSPENK